MQRRVIAARPRNYYHLRICREGQSSRVARRADKRGDIAGPGPGGSNAFLLHAFKYSNANEALIMRGGRISLLRFDLEIAHRAIVSINYGLVAAGPDD